MEAYAFGAEGRKVAIVKRRMRRSCVFLGIAGSLLAGPVLAGSVLNGRCTEESERAKIDARSRRDVRSRGLLSVFEGFQEARIALRNVC